MRQGGMKNTPIGVLTRVWVVETFGFLTTFFMYTRNRFLLFLGISIFFLLGLSSCQKEGLMPVTTSGGLAKPDLTVGLPPVLVAWTGLPKIPYKDDIAGDVPIANDYPLGFVINGKGFVLGSLLTTSWITGDYISDLWQFDPSGPGWTKKSSCPASGGSLIEAVVFVIGDNAYVVAHNQTWQYNQPTDSWTQKATLPGDERMNATGFAINGKGYLGLGWDEDAPGSGLTELNDWWQYDPVADQWTKKGTFPGSKREGAEGFVIDGLGYVISGTHYANGQGNFGKTVWQYNPLTDHWTQKGDFPGTGRWHAVAANGTIGGADVGFIAGGDNDGFGPTDSDLWEYYPPTDSWVKESNILGGARTGSAGFVLGHSLFIVNITGIAYTWSR
jgi:N-acetylneuraminic acid mutarotase